MWIQSFIWALVSVLYFPVLQQLYHGRWELVDYSHAHFILPASLFIVWHKRKALMQCPRSPAPGGSILLLLFGLFLFVFGWRRDFLFISTLSLIPVVSGMVLFLYGLPILRALSFPIAYLLLMVPPPLGLLDALTLPMRYGVSKAATTILQSFFIPVERQGLMLYIERKEVFIAPACSGFRSLITFFSLAVLYVYFTPSTLRKKIILILSVIPLALFGNLVRVLVLCLITYYFGEEASHGFLHDFSGFLVFGIIVLGFLLIDKLYVEDLDDADR